jgi:hypothetical protein
LKKIYFTLILAVFLVACTNQKNTEFPLDNYPEDFYNQVNSLPEQNQKQLKAPTSFPFEVKYVNFTKDENRNGIILTTGIDFEHEPNKVNIHLTAHYNNNLKSSENNKTVELNNNIKATIKTDEDKIKSITWRENSTLYTISMIASDNYEEEITIDQLVIIANSMKKIN